MAGALELEAFEAAAGQSVLVVFAHPDDAEFGCGGTIALLAAAGATVFYAVATSGDKGDDEGSRTPAELAGLRKTEQRSAAAELGVSDVFFLDREDGSLFYGPELRGEVVRLIRQLKPDMVFTFDPTVVFDEYGEVNHADHRAIGLAAVDACHPFARGALCYPEQISQGLAPHRVREIFLWSTNAPNCLVEITKTLVKKSSALAMHKSQFPDPHSVQQTVIDRARSAGRLAGVEYAEPFRRIRLR